MYFHLSAETSDVIDFFARVAGAFGVCVTAAIAIVAVLKYRSDRKAQNRNNALQSYGTYLKVAFDNPEFARPDDWEKIKNDRAAYKKYRWFVSIMLLAFEESILPHWIKNGGKRLHGKSAITFRICANHIFLQVK